MRRAFVRGLWGNNQGSERRPKIDRDIEMVLFNRFTTKFVTYVCGQDNYDYLVDRGLMCKLLDKKPFLYNSDKTRHMYGHKLMIWQAAMRDYEEIVFLDWDCVPAKVLSDSFWGDFCRKSSFQSSLRAYMKPKCLWRKTAKRQRPCASFVYCRDKNITNALVQEWQKRPHKSEEDIMAMYTDELTGGWQGHQMYWDLFEPNCFNLGADEVRFQCFPREWLLKKQLSFVHINRQYSVPRIFNVIKNIDDVEKKKDITTEQIVRKLRGLKI
jgi:hypothetical protein